MQTCFIVRFFGCERARALIGTVTVDLLYEHKTDSHSHTLSYLRVPARTHQKHQTDHHPSVVELCAVNIK